MHILDHLSSGRLWIRILVASALLLITAALGTGLASLRFDFSAQALFETGNDDDVYLQQLERDFGPDDGQLMLVIERPAGVFQPELLAYVDRLTRAFDEEPWSKRAEGLTTVQIAMPPEEDEEVLRVQAIGLGASETLVAGDPMLDGLFVNADRTATTILVDIDESFETVDELRPWMRRTDALLEIHPAPPGSRVIAYGLPYLRVAAVDIMQADQAQQTPIALVMFMVAVALLFGGRVVVTFATILPIALAVICTVGLMGLTGETMNVLTNVLPLLLLTIGMSDAIHFLARAQEEQTAVGEWKEALRITTRRIVTACFLTSFTTAIGFASLLVSRTTILAHFAWIAAAGVIFAYVITMTLLPVLLSFARPLDRKGRVKLPGLDRAIARLAGFVTRRSGLCLGLSAVSLAVVATLATRVEIDSRVHEAFDPKSELYARQMTAESAVGGLLPFVVSVRGNERNRLRDPEVIRRVWALQQYVESQPGASRALSPASLVHALDVAFRGELPARAIADRSGPLRARCQHAGQRPGCGGTRDPDPLLDPNLPNDPRELAQLLFLGELGDESLLWERVVTKDWQHLRIVTRLEDRGSRQFIPMFEDVQKKADELFAGVEGVTVRLTGEGYVASMALEYFIWDLLDSLVLAIVVIFVAVGLFFRSLRLALISVPPNVIPLAGTLALLAVTGMPLNTATILAFPIALGLAVDDTIHMLARFREERATSDVHHAVQQTMLHSGRAVIFTSVLLAAGVSILLSADFLATRRFALILLVAVGTALATDLFMLPALLVRFGRAKPHATSEPRPTSASERKAA